MQTLRASFGTPHKINDLDEADLFTENGRAMVQVYSADYSHTNFLIELIRLFMSTSTSRGQSQLISGFDCIS